MFEMMSLGAFPMMSNLGRGEGGGGGEQFSDYSALPRFRVDSSVPKENPQEEI